MADQGAAQAAQQVAQAIQAAVAGLAPPAGAAAPAPVVFATSPAQAAAGLIDYSTPAGIKLFNKATAALPGDDKYDLKAKGIKIFLTQLEERGKEFGWSGITTIPDSAATPRNIYTKYGLLTEADVRAHVNTYSGAQDRNVQNAAQMAKCIWNSLTQQAVLDLEKYRTRFVVAGEANGPLMLFCIIERATITVRATTAVIRANIIKLSEEFASKDFDVEAFNDYVDEQLRELDARGQESQDVLTHLFTAYEQAPDHRFTEYIQRKKDAYEENTINLDASTLMSLALEKYKTLVTQKEWRRPTKQDEELIALRAELEKAKKSEQQKSSKKGKAKGKKSGDDEKKTKTINGKEIPLKDVWMHENKDNKKTMTRKGKTWYWCPKHKKWCKHKPEDCRLQLKDDDTPQTKQNKPKKDEQEEALKITKALQATANLGSDFEGESDE